MFGVRRAGCGVAKAAVRQQQQRGLAAAAADVKLPIKLYGVSAKYANALYLAAAKAGELPKVAADMETIASWGKENKSFREYVNNPIISRADKVKDMDKISAGMANSTRGFLNVLADNGRLVELDGVVKTFAKLMGAQQGIVDATVTAAAELSPKQHKAIQKAISSGYLEKGQTLNLEVKVNPGIIGGLQVQIGDRFLDLCIQSEINNVNKAL